MNRMSSQQPQPAEYGFSKIVDVPYEEAVEKARAALKEEGFGVLCEIDIKEKLKERLGVDFRKYVILGAVQSGSRLQDSAGRNQHWVAPAMQCHRL